MTGVSPRERYSRHLRDAQPTAYGLRVVGCMDDNFPKPNDPVLGGALYDQIAGATDGLGMDTFVAREMWRPGDVSERSVMVHQAGKHIASLLHGVHRKSVLHSFCAAWGKAEAINETTRSEDQQVFGRAIEISNDVTQERYEGVVQATDRIVRSGLVASVETSSARYARHSRISPMVPVAELADTAHIADTLISLQDPDKMFDVRAAREGGDPALCIGLGAMGEVLHDLKQADRDLFGGITEGNFLAATAIRTSSIVTRHLLGPDGHPVSIVQL